MAKITGPLFSQSATGSIAKRVTFRETARGTFAHKTPKASTSATPGQIAQRANYQDAIVAWHALDGPTKQYWREIGIIMKMTGYNAFISDYLSALNVPAGIQWDSGATIWDSGSTIWDN